MLRPHGQLCPGTTVSRRVFSAPTSPRWGQGFRKAANPSTCSVRLRTAARDEVATKSSNAHDSSSSLSSSSSSLNQAATPPHSADGTSSSRSSGSASTSSTSSGSTQVQGSRGRSRSRKSRSVSPQNIPTSAIGVSGPYITTASMDGDQLIGVEFLERELIGPFTLTPTQLKIVHELQESMMSCSNAFVGVAVMGIALSVAAAHGLEVEDAPEVLFNGITVGDFASWVDSLLVAGLLRFGADSFKKVEDSSPEKQMAFTFQGISRLGIMFQQFGIAAGAVSIVTTLEASSKWPPIVTLASGLFFTAAVARSTAMWFVLSKYGTKLDDVDAALETERRCMEAANDKALPLIDRLAIRIAFNYLLEFNSVGRRASEATLSTGAAIAHPDGDTATVTVLASRPSSAGAAAADLDSDGSLADGSSSRWGIRGAAANTAARAQAAAQGVADAAKQGRVAAREAVVKGMTMLRSVPLPIISRSGDEEERAFSSGSDSESDEPNNMTYDLTVQEERLVQAVQNSLNSAGLALVLQSFATGLLLTADLATGRYSAALGDTIQAINKAVAAELIFIGTTNFDRALYTEGCDVEHLLEGLGKKGITKLFHNLSILAWAVVIAKGVSLLAPWEESSPLFKFLSENVSHRAADVVLEAQEILVQLLQ